MARLTPRRRRRAASALLVLALLAVAACGAASPAAQTTDVYHGAPWGAGERLEYSLRNESGDLLGHGLLLARIDEDGRLLLEQQYIEEAPEGVRPIEDDVVVVVDPATLRPIEGWRDIVRRDSDGTPIEERYEWEYVDGADERRLVARLVTRDGVDERDFAVRQHHYDNETSLWLWRSIDFIDDYDEQYTSVNPMERSQQTVNIRIPQVEEIDVPAGEFRAWRIVVRTGRAARTAWVNVDPPHEVLRWDNGEIIFDLERRTVE